MTLSISKAELARLHAHAEQGFPHEVVGILAGSRADNVVSTVAVLLNERADSAHNRYTVSGLALSRAEQRLVDSGLEIVGYYHSHPDHPAQYSDFDRDHAWPNMSYVIVSVLSGRASNTLSWRLRDDRSAMDPESITVSED